MQLLYICVYALVCVYVIFAAQLLAEVTTAVLREFVTEEEENGMISGGAGTQAGRYWTTERFLSCVAGIAIGINAAKEWREWHSEPSNAKVCHRLLRATMKAMCRGFKPGRESDTEEAGTYAAGSDEEESVLAEQLQRTGSEGEDKAEANDYAKNAGLASETSISGSANEMAGEKLAEDSKRSHRRVADIVRDIDAGDSGNSITANSSSSSSNLGDSGSDGSEIIAMSDGNNGPQRLLIVAIFGTLDSMAVFAAIILGGSESIYSLLIGVSGVRGTCSCFSHSCTRLI